MASLEWSGGLGDGGCKVIGGLGTDLVRVARFRRFLEEGKTACWSGFLRWRREITLFQTGSGASSGRPVRRQGELFQGLGTGFRDGLSWQEIEVVQ
jgi:phosphopantetheinyl transferase (holo-ACP synthase)